MSNQNRMVKFLDDFGQICYVRLNDVIGLTPNEIDPNQSDIHQEHGFITVRAKTDRVSKELGLDNFVS